MRRLPGGHEPNNKNRSSKQYTWLTKLRPIVRCVNNTILTEWSNINIEGAHAELKRRQAKHAKNEVK